MYYLVSADHNGMAAHLTRSDCEGSNAMDGTDDKLWWNDSEETGDVSSECGEDEGSDCKDGETGTDRYRYIKYKHTLCIKCKQLIVKYFS
jgi:hypothetical protein